ncbi:hypothetical protein IQ283_04270 [Alkalihalobacillus hwajinpoensis]|uniref:hypothetical protein n=1 Tax=Guptibacillus hwajinpoensis TaxID=208199 RepID=UPI00188376AE|nr:hypothetical protein [Pseudalkalibacillus hwajinpoensis]MBF0705812.1 hypothetical protein [Pseudalkalibacillus hwajinpoensis]
MGNEMIFILVLVSMVIWVKVSKEAVKPSKEISWWKMVTLLSAGSLSTLFITLSLFQGMSL